MQLQLHAINQSLSDLGVVDDTLHHRAASMTAEKKADLREELRATYSNASES
jgi:hypothetical protein